MKKYLAIGSSQLGGFKRGVDLFNSQLYEDIDFARLWETGFGYLELNSQGLIVAPDKVPEQNNGKNINLKSIWKIHRTSRLPCIYDYQKIFVLASPCKYFSPFYYQKGMPIPLSSVLLKACLNSWQIDCLNYDAISPWHFRISSILGQIVRVCPEKVVFIGAPLPIEGAEKNYFETLRTVLEENSTLKECHLENMHKIRQLCSISADQSEGMPLKIFLPPAELLCDLTLTTLSKFSPPSGSAWHASLDYWHSVVSELARVDRIS
jgi:hypothetical protein